jgi:hypothetical protein
MKIPSGVVASSEFCRKKLLEGKPKDLPWDELKPGLSFCIEFGIIDENCLRSKVASVSKTKNTKFKCIKNNDYRCFEVTVADETYNTPIAINIVESSPQMKERFNDGFETTKYPLSSIPEGMSITYKIGEVNIRSLRCVCSRVSRELNKKFVLHVHKKLGIVEVANVPIKKATFFECSPELIAKINGERSNEE